MAPRTSRNNASSTTKPAAAPADAVIDVDSTVVNNDTAPADAETPKADDVKPESSSDNTQAQPQTQAEKDEADDKAYKNLEAESILVSNEAQALLQELYKDPSSKESKNKLGEASQATIMAASMLVNSHLLCIDQKPQFTKLPSAMKEEIQETLGQTKRDAVLKAARILSRESCAIGAEYLDTYSDFGPAYAGIPLGLDIGIELGIKTGEGTDVKRSGIVFGLRSDHMAGRKPLRAASNFKY